MKAATIGGVVAASLCEARRPQGGGYMRSVNNPYERAICFASSPFYRVTLRLRG